MYQTDNEFVSRIIDYESGNMEEDEVIEFFQYIYDTQSYKWLQGHYGRTLNLLIQGGYINA